MNKKILFLIFNILCINLLAITPVPESISEGSGKFSISSNFKVLYKGKALKDLAEVISSDFERLAGFSIKVEQSDSSEKGSLFLSIEPSLEAESYELEINDRIEIKGGDFKACSWAHSSLIHLFKSGTLPCLSVKDKPQYAYRSIMIDLARRWHPASTLKDIINLARLYKINYVHLHLSDNQSFTFPSKRFPELGTKNRCYTEEQMLDIVSFADSRGVTLIPEIDVPGHAGAWVGKLPEYFGTYDSEKGVYRNVGVVNAANEKAYFALDILMKELSETFKSSPYIHIGTDEVSLDGLKNLPEYMPYVKKHALKDAEKGNSKELFNHFIIRMDKIVKKYGKKTMVWGPLSHSETNTKIPKDITVVAWDNIPEKELRDGHTVINACWLPLYMVPSQGRIPTSEMIYSWNVEKFDSWDWIIGKKLNKTPLLAGAQMCFWEQRHNEVIPILYKRLPAFAQKTWNPNIQLGYSKFENNIQKSIQTIKAIVNPINIKISGLTDAFNNTFSDKLIVELSSKAKGVIRYTIDKSWTNVPSLKDRVYTDKFILNDSCIISAQLFDVKGNKIGGLEQKYVHKITPYYSYSVVGPMPKRGWSNMPDFNQLKVLQKGVLGKMTKERVGQINRSMFAGLDYYGHIETRIENIDNVRALILKGKVQFPKEGVYEILINARAGMASLLMFNKGGKVHEVITDKNGKGKVYKLKVNKSTLDFQINYFNRYVFNDLNIKVKAPGQSRFIPFESLVLPLYQ